MSYTAPVDRISFSLKHEAGFDRLYEAIPGLDSDVISSILEEAGKFTTEVIAPTNRIGDEEKAHLGSHGVVVPEAFKDAYKQLVDNGWPTLSASEASSTPFGESRQDNTTSMRLSSPSTLGRIRILLRFRRLISSDSTTSPTWNLA